jgi:hypothetical protein
MKSLRPTRAMGRVLQLRISCNSDETVDVVEDLFFATRGRTKMTCDGGGARA